MTNTLSPRIVMFPYGHVVYRDFTNRYVRYVKYIPDLSDASPLTFTRIGNKRWHIEETNQDVFTRKIVTTVNTAGVIQHFKTAILIVGINDIYMRNPTMFRIPRELVYRVRYFSTYEECIVNRRFKISASRISLIPLGDDSPLTTTSRLFDVIGV